MNGKNMTRDSGTDSRPCENDRMRKTLWALWLINTASLCSYVVMNLVSFSTTP
ncbi:MAG: hypothetical protein P8016_06180 [Sedimentisphaerales bacterium]